MACGSFSRVALCKLALFLSFFFSFFLSFLFATDDVTSKESSVTVSPIGQPSREERVEEPSLSILEIEELKPHIRSGDIEITPENIAVIKGLAATEQQAFNDHDRGVYVKKCTSSRGEKELEELLSKFTNIKRLKIEIDWERENDEEEMIIEAIERTTSLYPKLEDLDLSDCRLTEQRLLRILDGLRDVAQLKRLNVRKNILRADIIEKLRQRLPNLQELGLKRTSVYLWKVPCVAS